MRSAVRALAGFLVTGRLTYRRVLQRFAVKFGRIILCAALKLLERSAQTSVNHTNIVLGE